MRIYRFSVIIGLVLVISVFICGSLSSAKASDYLGEFCWSALKTEDEHGPKVEGPFIVRMGVTYMGGNYYLLQGTFATPDGPVVIAGTAITVGNEVLTTMTMSQDHTPAETWRDSGIFQFRLSVSTLNGTFWSNYMSINTNTRVMEIGYGAGTMTFTTCP